MKEPTKDTDSAKVGLTILDEWDKGTQIVEDDHLLALLPKQGIVTASVGYGYNPVYHWFRKLLKLEETC